MCRLEVEYGAFMRSFCFTMPHLGITQLSRRGGLHDHSLCPFYSLLSVPLRSFVPRALVRTRSNRANDYEVTREVRTSERRYVNHSDR